MERWRPFRTDSSKWSEHNFYKRGDPICTMKKYPKIRRIGHAENGGIVDHGQLVVKEKLDGASFRYMQEAHLDEEHHTPGRKLVFGSRNVVYKNEKDIDKNFTHAVEYVRENLKFDVILEAEVEYGSIVVYGEAMHPHTLEYDWENTPSFVGFDIWSVDQQQFLPWSEAQEIIDAMGLPTIPTIYKGPAETFMKEYDISQLFEGGDITSAYRNGLPEGVVIRNEDTGRTAKVRTQQFKEAHTGQTATDPDDYEPSDAQALARKFTTEARVIKMIHKYEDRGETIEMSIMESLWAEVFEDIIEEEYETIFLGNHEIDTKEFRSEVASITASVLESYLARPEGSVLNQ